MNIIIGKEFPKKVIPLINNAKKSIDIIVFDWRWYVNDPSNPVQLFNQSIVRAVNRKVKVRAIVNTNAILPTLKSVGINVKKLLGKNVVHCKIIIIDDIILVTGSHNYTQYAFTMNYEASIICSGQEEILRIRQFFNTLFLNH